MLKEEVSTLNKQNILVPFIAVVETWIKPFISDSQLHIDNYNVFRADRKFSKNGGTLLIFPAKTFEFPAVLPARLN